MYVSVAVLAPLLSLALAGALPEVTPGPRSPAHHDLIKLRALERRAAELYGRQRAGDLAFCFGRNSICEQSNDLNDECDQFDNNDDLTPWYQCLCTNGYVSTREACGWCNDAWGIDQIEGINELNSRQCTSYSFSIAPIPASVLALQTSYNSTWTGTLLGTATIGDAITTTSDRSAATTSDAGGIGATIGGGGDDTTRTTAEETTRTLDGGGDGPTVTRTVFGDSQTNGADAESATSTPTGGSSPSGATGLKTGAGFLFSVFAFGFAGMCLL